MYRPYKTPVIKAYPDIRLPEPRVLKSAIGLLKVLARGYLCLFIGMARVVLRGEKELFDAFKRALASESRCIVAFRHPYGMEAQLLTWFFLFRLKVFAAKKGVRFVRRPHAIFIYGYEAARWGGFPARFIMPRVGALPIHHAKMDSKGMDRIYHALTCGPYPIALAPEGQVSYTADSVPRLEPGVIRIGLTAAERLEKAGNSCPVEVLPLSFNLRYGRQKEAAMEKLLAKIEKMCGCAGKGKKFTERLDQCREKILAANEARYGIKGNGELPFEERLDAVINAALETAERTLGFKSEGELFSRMYRIRQICWDRIAIPEMLDFKKTPPIERSVMDLQAGEAWHISRHQEIVDFCWYFRIPLPPEDSPLHVKIEYVQNLFDFASRTRGGAFSDRAYIAPQKIIIQAAPVINLSERLSSYHNDKKGTIAQAMDDLSKAYLDSIEQMQKLEQGKI